MKTLLYSDKEGSYRLFDYDQSHSLLLFRKHKGKHLEYNIDVLFKGVYSLNISIIYKGLHIYSVDRLNNQTANNLANRNIVFMLRDNEELISYIDAAAFGVFENSLNYTESSLSNFKENTAKKPKIWFAESSLRK